ncbi:hypothetical protein ACWF0M_15435 [Kribbella sp. NPDC055110]
MTQPPNPYGPPNSGWQQQPTQPPYGPPGPGYGPGPAYGPGGYGPGGPRRPPTLLYVAIAVVGVLAVLGIVALILPGLTGDDNQGGPAAPSPASSQPTGAPQPTSSEPSYEPSSAPTSAPTSAPSTPAPRLTEAGTLATRFLALLNANDKKRALALGCTDSKQLLEGLLVFVDPPTKLSVTGPAASVRSYYPRISVPFAGTNNGSVPWAGTVDIMDVPSQPLCVRLMSRSR